MPILHVEAKGKTNILVGSSFKDICVLPAGGLLILYSCRNVQNHLIPFNVLGRCHLALSSSSSPGTARMPAVTSTTPAMLVLLLVGLLNLLLVLQLVPLEGRGRKDLWGWRIIGPSHLVGGGFVDSIAICWSIVCCWYLNWLLFSTICWSNVLIWVALASMEAVVCLDRLAMCKSIKPAMVYAVLLLETSSSGERPAYLLV